MSKVYTVMLRLHGETTGLMLYQARAKSRNALVLLMNVQGLVPKYDILSVTERPAREFVLGVLFPRTVQTNNADLKEANKDGGLKSYFKPLVCWLKRDHPRRRYGEHGEICRRCKTVFPNEEASK
jgi:hypothetical protein